MFEMSSYVGELDYGIQSSQNKKNHTRNSSAIRRSDPKSALIVMESGANFGSKIKNNNDNLDLGDDVFSFNNGPPGD